VFRGLTAYEMPDVGRPERHRLPVPLGMEGHQYDAVRVVGQDVWEPFTVTWSIRRQDQCRTPNPFGAGEWVADFEIPEPAPVPMTTIAWLYWHMGSMPGRLCDIDLLGGTRTMASGWTSPYLTHHPVFTSAADAVTALRNGWHRLRGAIERADDDQLEVTTAGYTYAAEPPRGGLCVPGPRAPRTRPRTSSPARSPR
jgi:hypothetical protein